MAKAMVLADRGDLAGAEGLGREAVDLANGSDNLDDRGYALSVLAQVAYDRKGNVVSAGRARERLAALG